MSIPFLVAERAVSVELQERFAALSGDRNPIHMDPIAARRTQAGERVVHGVHLLLWALDAVAAKGLLVFPLQRLRVRFLKWVYLEDRAAVSLPGGETLNPKAFDVMVGGLQVLSVDLSYGERLAPSDEPFAASPFVPIAQALERSIDELEGVSGEAYTAPADEAVAEFPALAGLLGGTAVAEMAACSYIVGMEAPGLHSMFSKADLTFAKPGQLEGARAALHFEVFYTDPRFRKARIAVPGRAVTGTLEVFCRAPPVQQPAMELLANYIVAGEFSEMRALVIGGSRGLGELTAKLIAAGGGFATITYALGRGDAERVQAQIAGFRGRSELMAYDVRLPPSGQLTALSQPPTHVFYFATPTIYRPKQGVLSGPVLAEFAQFYLLGFYDLCVALIEAGASATLPAGKLVALYPSTVFIEQRPAGMTEYAMVKAAGEQLCADMNQYLPGIRVVAHRFPKLPTDQTAGVVPERETDAIEAMLPVLRVMMKL